MSWLADSRLFGTSIDLAGDRLSVRQASASQLALIRENKDAILAELRDSVFPPKMNAMRIIAQRFYDAGVQVDDAKELIDILDALEVEYHVNHQRGETAKGLVGPRVLQLTNALYEASRPVLEGGELHASTLRAFPDQVAPTRRPPLAPLFPRGAAGIDLSAIREDPQDALFN